MCETPDAADGPKGRGEYEELVFGELCREAYIDIWGLVIGTVRGWFVWEVGARLVRSTL